MLSTPVKFFFLYVIFALQCFTLGIVQQGKGFLLSTGKVQPPKNVRVLLLLNLGVALFNMLPLYPLLDGGKIAHDVVLPLIGHYSIVTTLAPYTVAICFFFVWIAFRQPFRFFEEVAPQTT